MRDSIYARRPRLSKSETQDAIFVVEHVIKLLAPSIDSARAQGTVPDLKPEQEAELLLCNELVRLLLTASNMAEYLQYGVVARTLKALTELLDPERGAPRLAGGHVLN